MTTNNAKLESKLHELHINALACVGCMSKINEVVEAVLTQELVDDLTNAVKENTVDQTWTRLEAAQSSHSDEA